MQADLLRSLFVALNDQSCEVRALAINLVSGAVGGLLLVVGSFFNDRDLKACFGIHWENCMPA